MHPRPFLKSAGGKTSLLSEILPRLPEKIGTYYEPFLGGGAVFFALADEGCFKRALLSDANEELIASYIGVCDGSKEVIRLLSKRAEAHSEKEFYRVRALDPKALDMSERAARTIYLNKTCFNGLYRVNRKGQFNVPFGDHENPAICDAENLLAVAEIFFQRNATLAALDFEAAVAKAGKSDTVYFDPPYAPVSETSSFTGYTKGGFTSKDQERLRDVAKRLARRGVHVLLSNSDTPLIRKLYNGFKIEEVRARRSINSKGGKRGAVGELLILAQ